MKFAADTLQRNCKYNRKQRNRPSTNTELLKIKHVWAMVRKLKQRVAWLGQRMIESKLIKATSWTQQNRKMQVMSLESNNPKDGYSAGGRKHGSCFLLWNLRLQKIANKKILMCYISKMGSCNFGWWIEGHPITAKGGREERVSAPFQCNQLKDSILFIPSVSPHQQ